MSSAERPSPQQQGNIIYVPEDLLTDSTESSTRGLQVVRNKAGRTALANAEIGAIARTAKVDHGLVGRGVRVGDMAEISGAVFGWVDIADRVVIGKNSRIGSPLKNIPKDKEGRVPGDAGYSREDDFTPDIHIGEDTYIGMNVRITPISGEHIKIDAHCRLGNSARIGPEEQSKRYRGITIGTACTVAEGTVIRQDVTLGDRVHIGRGYILEGMIIPSDTTIHPHGGAKQVRITPQWLESNPLLVETIPIRAEPSKL